MLDNITKRRIDDCRDILVGKLPDPKSQIEQITIALIYKFMDDMDKEAVELGGKAKFFSDYTVPDPNDPKKEIVVPFQKYSWDNLFDTKVSASEMLKLYSEAIEGMVRNPNIPELFANIFKNAYLPYRDPETLKMFLKTISEFEYTHSEKLGDAFEYLLSVMGSQGDAGQFRTPRHIIDFLVAAVDPGKNDSILDPACGTAGFLISAFKHIKQQNNNILTPDEQTRVIKNFVGYDISPDMVRLSLVNLYLHGFSDPHIYEYDSLSSEERWNETFDVILANPPFMSPKGGIRPHKKFTITSNRSEVLFVDYIAEHLNPKGRAGIIVPEGIIFQSGTAYKALRKMLVDKYLYAVVSLPAGVFNPYSGVKTSILLMDADLAKKTKDILFVKIDNDGYGLGAQRNAVKGGQLEEAIATLKAFRENCFEGTSFENTKLAQAVGKVEIGKSGDFNLSGERYKKTRDLISSHYHIIKLGDCCDIFNGSTPSKGNQEFWNDGNIPWFTIEDIRKNGRTIFDTTQKITEKALTKTSIKLLPPNTVLLCCTASVGEYAFAVIPVTTNQQFNGLVVKESYKNKLLPKFLYQLASTFKEELIRISGQTSFNFVSVGVLKTLEIPLPPLSVQEEIVTEIESYQKIIDGAKMVVDNCKPRIEVDEDWEIVELGDIAKPEYGFTEKAKDDGEVRFIRITDIGADGKLIDSDAKYIDLTKEAKKSILKKDDVLLARTGATYGKTMIFDETYPAVFASFLMRLNFTTDKIYPKYYWAFAQSESYINQAASLMTGGGQPQFNGNAVVKIKLPLPPIEIQQQIVVQIEKEQALVNANKELIAIYEQKIMDRIGKVWGE